MIVDMRKSQKTKTPKETTRRRKTRTAAPDNVAAPRDPDVPYWLPADSRWDHLPEEIRQAVPRILTPAYRRFVLDAPGELERSMGLTLVHLMWLELCGQVQMAVAAADPNALAAILQNPDDLIDRHLHLVATKCQTAELLVKLRIMSEMLDRPAPARASPAAALRSLGTRGNLSIQGDNGGNGDHGLPSRDNPFLPPGEGMGKG